jgi:hypothetical protein
VSNDLRQLWLDALRRGEYKQGKHRLRSRWDEFCCLGVLCDIHDSSRWTTNGDNDPVYIGSLEGTTNNSMGALPDEIAELMGLSNLGLFYLTDTLRSILEFHIPDEQLDGIFTDNNELSCLSILNDQGWSFEDISHVIEHARFMTLEEEDAYRANKEKELHANA